MPKVTIAGIGDVNFPDSMTPEQIQQAIETDILPKARAKQGETRQLVSDVGALVNPVNLVKGAAETMAAGLQGVPGEVIGGIAGLGAVPVKLAQGKPASDAADVVERVRNAVNSFLPQFGPQSPEAQAIARLSGKVADIVHGGTDVAGEKVMEATGSPLAGALVSKAPELAATVAGARLGVPRVTGARVTRVPGSPRELVVRSENGKSEVRVRPDNTLQEVSTETAAKAQGQGEGVARLEALIEHSRKNKYAGVTSDIEVTPAAQNMYAKLRERGHTVEQNPNVELLPDGKLRSTDTRPVYTVTERPATAADIKAQEGGVIQRTADTLLAGPSPKGQARVRRLTARQQRDFLGPAEDQAAVVTAIERGEPLVEGVQPTAAELTANIPAGTAVKAAQELVARQAGGPSTRFNERAIANEAARAAESKRINEEFGPQFDAILARANEKGAADARLLEGKPEAVGIKSGAVKRGLINLMRQPEYLIEGSTVRRSVKRLIKSLDNMVNPETGLVNAEAIQKLRQQVGTVIGDVAGKPGAEKKFARNIMEIKSAIDDAIEAAGGKGWKDLQAKYAAARKNLEAAEDLAEQIPLQRTSAAGVKESIPQLPNLLNRLLLATNAILRARGAGTMKLVTEEMARQYLNPQELAAVLRGEPPTPGTIRRVSKQIAAGVKHAVGSALPGTMADDQRRRSAQAAALRGQ